MTFPQRCNSQRRRLLTQGGMCAALAAFGLTRAHSAAAESEELAFDAESMEDALRALGSVPAVSGQIVLTVPDLVENGAVVPVTIESFVPGTREIYLIVGTNPNPVAARFTIPEGTDSFVSTRIKMAQSGLVYAVVRTGAQLYVASKHADVLIGGCA